MQALRSMINKWDSRNQNLLWEEGEPLKTDWADAGPQGTLTHNASAGLKLARGRVTHVLEDAAIFSMINLDECHTVPRGPSTRSPCGRTETTTPRSSVRTLQWGKI